MKILLDTNIIIHRETEHPIDEDIGLLFKWIDNLKYGKYIHPITIKELNKYKDEKILNSFRIKLENYNTLPTTAPLNPDVQKVSNEFDHNENDINDSLLLNEIFCSRVDILISEDRKILIKAEKLGIDHKVFSIDTFLEKVISENPDLVDYKVLSVKKEYFGNIDINDTFFDSFKVDYEGFEEWYNKKSDQIAYVCKNNNNEILAFLYLKIESENENYSDITPAFTRKKRLKVGTFKVTVNGFKLGERFLKIIFDNAIINKVGEIYLTIFNNSIEQKRL